MIYHPAEERGYNDLGWLKTHHSFSFGQYFDQKKVNFGALRVLNDDIVAPGMGFGTHPHENMEIISIPLSGGLKHKDSGGSTSTIRKNEVQVMSAGTGIYHSEFNASKEEPVNFLQLWIFPRERGLAPRYDEKNYDPSLLENNFFPLVLPGPRDDGKLWINQNAFISLGVFSSSTAEYTKHLPENGIYFFILSGSGEINGHPFKAKDGFGTEEAPQFSFNQKTEILAIEVPMDY